MDILLRFAPALWTAATASISTLRPWGVLLGSGLGWGLVCGQPAWGQAILRDFTLPTNTIVNNSGTSWTISGGTTNQAGNLLFHSFQNFRVESGNTAIFQNPTGITDIVARVTGSLTTNIFGTITRSNLGQPVNLFLINPKGINIAGTAQLNIGGSFLATTGDRFLFPDGSYFSASERNRPPLLVVNPPSGVLMNQNSGAINLSGGTHGLSFNSDFSINRTNRRSGLQVNQGQAITLIGNGINLTGANLTARQGVIELASVGSGTVTLNPVPNPWRLSYNEAQTQFKPITLNTSSSIDVSGPGGGYLSLQGSQILLNNGSVLLADTLGSQAGGLLRVRGTESVAVTGVRNNFASGLYASVDPGFAGAGGDLRVISPSFVTANGAIVGVDTYGSGNAGVLDVQAQDVIVDRATWSVQSFPQATGRAGRIQVTGDRLRVTNGGQILAQTLGRGQAGEVVIQAQESITIEGERLVGSSSVINSLITASKQGSSTGSGLISITTGQLLLNNGGRISLTTQTTNPNTPQGQILIQANQGITITGTSSNGVPSIITTTTSEQNPGGNIGITTPRLTLSGGGQISSGTFGSGQGGNLVLTLTEGLDVTGSVPVPNTNMGGLAVFRNATNTRIPSGLFAGSEGTGSAGNLVVSAPQVGVSQGGELTVSSGTQGGNAGILRLTAGTILLDQGARVRGDTQGRFGNIEVTADRLELNNGSILSTNATGQSLESGEINLTLGSLNLRGGSAISSDTAAGLAGNLTIVARQAEGIRLDNSRITATGGSGSLSLTALTMDLANGSLVSTDGESLVGSDGLNSTATGGNILLTATESLNLSQSQITANARNGSGGQVTLRSAAITLGSASTISTNVSGLALSGDTAGNINLIADTLRLGNSEITSNATTGGAGNINIQATNPLAIVLNQSRITATGGSGNLTLNALGDIQLLNQSLLSTDGQGSQSGGSITLNAPHLTLNDSAITTNATTGGAGNINIQATNPLAIVLDQSRITATGGSGNLTLNALGDIQLLNQSLLSTDGQGSQSGGSITLNAPHLTLNASAITTNALGTGAGSGNVTLTLGSLNLSNLSQIASDATAGSAGNITLQVTGSPGMNLDRSRITATGGGGNLNLTTSTLTLRQDSLLSTNGRGQESGGNITLQASQLITLEDSSITANADNSFGGQIAMEAPRITLTRSTITTNILGTQVSPTITGGNITLRGGSIYLQDSSAITSNATAGGAGNITLEATAPNTIRLTRSRITATGGLGNLTLRSTGNIELLDNSLISTDGQGSQPGGNITITTGRFLIGLGDSDITANADNSGGGRVSISTQGVMGLYFRDRLTPQNDITATSNLGQAFQGTVTIQTPESQVDSGLTELPTTLIDPSDQVATGCAASQGNSLAILGSRGIPPSPIGSLQATPAWQDLQMALPSTPEFPPTTAKTSAPTETTDLPHSPPLKEASTWVQYPDGTIALITQPSSQDPLQAQTANTCRVTPNLVSNRKT